MGNSSTTFIPCCEQTGSSKLAGENGFGQVTGDGEHSPTVTVDALSMSTGVKAEEATDLTARAKKCATIRKLEPPPPVSETAEDNEEDADVGFASEMSPKPSWRDQIKPALHKRATAHDIRIDPYHGTRRTVVNGNGESYAQFFSEIELLGQGCFGTVWKAVDTRTDEEVASKKIPFANIPDAAVFAKELGVARQLAHPYIIKLLDVVEDVEHYYLVMELCCGGDLFDQIEAINEGCKSIKKVRGLPGRRLKLYIWQMLSGMAYLHHYRFCHRDIKPENYMLTDRNDDACLKLVDFGLAHQLEDDEIMTTLCGTVQYIAPEVFKGGGYDEKCDIWGLGVTLYVCCTALSPFNGKDDAATIREIKRAKVDFNVGGFKAYPAEARELVKHLLTRQAERRPTAKYFITKDPWVQSLAPAAMAKEDPPAESRDGLS